MQQKAAQFELERWIGSEVFTWPWWFLLALFLIPWFVLFKLIDRSRAYSIWFFGLIVLIITSFTDDLGAEIGAWVYPVKLVPYSLIGFPYDFSMVPVAQMLIFQYFRTWKSFSAGLLCQALATSFEPKITLVSSPRTVL
ncbi:CBO0543 family protein [Paenibacillus chartarius]|uniref:CBO0543 family protein n=1 Tax=Paenibacillus chartarius TaxID=747481 RepID=A0ABV6DFQ5_9BACL